MPVLAVDVAVRDFVGGRGAHVGDGAGEQQRDAGQRMVAVDHDLECEACSVSVSVRPERLSVAGVSRDPGHHSRFMPFALLLATAARGIGVDSASCWKPIHRDEPLTQGSEVRLCGAALD